MRASLEHAIRGTLSGCARALEEAGPARWRFDLGNGTPLPVTARREDGWLHFRSALAGWARQPAWALLELNGTLPAPARVVHNPLTRMPELRADLWLESDSLPARIAAACEALHRAGARLAGKPPEHAPPPGPVPCDSWVALAEERGWRVERRETGRISVDLELPGPAGQAWAAVHGGELTFGMDLLRSPALSTVSRRAASGFLLSATGAVRLVRAVATGADAPDLRLEVRLAAAAAAEIDCALAALALAARHTVRELHALTVESAAEAFLARVPNSHPKD